MSSVTAMSLGVPGPSSSAAQPMPRVATPSRGDALRVRLGQHSERGRKPVNQDFCGASAPTSAQLSAKGLVLALADGIGSSDVSQDAAQAAVRSALEDYYCTCDAWSVKRSMQRVLAATNSWLHAQTRRSPYRDDMDRGYVCAMSMLVLKGRTAHLFHVGDVRIYRLQGSTLEPLTEDHRVWVGGGQSCLSRAMGFHPQLDLDYRALPLECGDIFVLASDGVHEHVEAATMARLLRAEDADLEATARHIVALALQGGSHDNLSVQLLRVEALPEADAGEAQHLRGGLPLAPPLKAGDEFDGYRIERELHASSRSHVFLATDLDSGHRVVLKTPSTELAQDEAHLDRFIMEEWIARRLDSAHVVKARSRARPRSHLYVVLEHVPGQTLAQWMRDHPAPELESVRRIVEQIARGLQALHRMEMLHQDLRAENIMVDSHGTVKIIDLGSVRVAGISDAQGSGTSAAALGDLATLAPEVLLDGVGSERADQFSLGVIAYQLLTGRLPYGTRAAGVRTRADLKSLSYVSALDERRRIPAWVDAALMKAVHPLPHKRYEVLSEFVRALQQPDDEFMRRSGQPLVERHPVLFWKLLALALLLVVLALAARLQGMPRSSAYLQGLPRSTALLSVPVVLIERAFS